METVCLKKDDDHEPTLRRCFTVALYGDKDVGKSSLLRQIVGEQPGYDNLTPTLGYEVIEEEVRGRRVRLVDASGDERWAPSMPWLKRADVVILVYAVHMLSSWLNLPQWLTRTRAWHGEPTTIIIVGTATQPTKRRMVSRRQASVSAMMTSVPYIEIVGQSDVESLLDLIEHYHTQQTQETATGFDIRDYRTLTSTPSPERDQAPCQFLCS